MLQLKLERINMIASKTFINLFTIKSVSIFKCALWHSI